MVSIILGMIGAVIGAGLFVGGWAYGVHSVCGSQTIAPPPTAEEEEQQKQMLQRIQEDQAAFTTLMGYNPDVAYGLQDLEKRTKR